jgi:hypothetical protein
MASCAFFFLVAVHDTQAQSALDIRGSLSVRISKGRLSFKVGEITNTATPGIVSERLELSLWLSKTPYDGSEPLRGTRLAKCNLDGIAGQETVANLSCQAKLKWISRGKYYFVITLSELDPSTGTFVERDFFRLSKRVKF